MGIFWSVMPHHHINIDRCHRISSPRCALCWRMSPTFRLISEKGENIAMLLYCQSSMHSKLCTLATSRRYGMFIGIVVHGCSMNIAAHTLPGSHPVNHNNISRFLVENWDFSDLLLTKISLKGGLRHSTIYYLKNISIYSTNSRILLNTIDVYWRCRRCRRVGKKEGRMWGWEVCRGAIRES